MCKTIKQKVKFNAPSKVVYKLLADAKMHRAFSGTSATISTKVGGPFSLHAGAVSGINVDLCPGKRIVQAWRANDFPPGIFSMASFFLNDTGDGGTQLTLTHRGVPKELIPRIENEWRERYWKKIKDYLAHHPQKQAAR